jgi:hypothetical protein
MIVILGKCAWCRRALALPTKAVGSSTAGPAQRVKRGRLGLGQERSVHCRLGGARLLP